MSSFQLAALTTLLLVGALGLTPTHCLAPQECDTPGRDCSHSSSATTTTTMPTTWRPAILIASSAANANKAGFASRTSDAIYRALSSVFSHDEDERQPEASSPTPIKPAGQPTGAPTGRNVPQTTTTTTTTTTTRTPTQLAPTTTGATPTPTNTARSRLVRVGELVHLFNSALGSALLVRETLAGVAKTRSTRLAGEPGEWTAATPPGPRSAAQQLAPADAERLATSEDIQLVCRLLRQQLDQQGAAENATTGAPAEQVQSQTHSAPNKAAEPAAEPPPPLLLAHQRLLNESESAHATHLLESVLALDAARLRLRANESFEQVGLHFLAALYGLAASQVPPTHLGPAATTTTTTRLVGADEPEVGDGQVSVRLAGQLSLLAPSRQQQHAHLMHLHLVYWLLEPVHNALPARWRVLDEPRAGQLLDQLDQQQVERLLGRFRLATPHRLLARFDPADPMHLHASDEPAGGHTGAPRLPEDEAGARPPEVGGLRLMVERLWAGPFWDNLHLYLALGLIGLVMVLLFCCAIPIMCFKRGSSRNRKRGSSHMNGERDELPPPPPVEQVSSSNNKQRAEESAIWRKLSTSTSTLIKDESTCVTTREHLPEVGWHSVEQQGRLARPQNEHRHTQEAQVSAERPTTGDFESQRFGSSDTLTKSELVLVKEKLVPIVSQRPPRSRQTTARQVEHVNQAVQTQLSADSLLGYMDSSSLAGAAGRHQPAQPPISRTQTQTRSRTGGSSSSSSSSLSKLAPGGRSQLDDRTPRRVEYPAGSRAKVEAIKSELAKLEQRDRELGGSHSATNLELPCPASYRRFEHI